MRKDALPDPRLGWQFSAVDKFWAELPPLAAETVESLTQRRGAVSTRRRLPADTVRDLRDRALIATLTYGFARNSVEVWAGLPPV